MRPGLREEIWRVARVLFIVSLLGWSMDLYFEFFLLGLFIYFIWSFRKEVIIQEEDYLKKGGTLIFHLPSLHVINKFNYKNYTDDNFETFSFNF